jgi:hypothetical protein
MLAGTNSTAPEFRARRVSIVIPTLGGPLIHECLESLRKNISTALTGARWW